MFNKSLLISMLLAALLVPAAVFAQTPNDVIVLDDATPALDVVINPNPDTTGVIALEINSATVTLTNAAGNIVFESVDPSIQALELRLAPNAGSHTLSIQRAANASQGSTRIISLSQMTAGSVVPTLVNSTTLAPAQEADYPLNSNSPSAIVDFNIPTADGYGALTASFPGAPVTVQLVNTTNNLPLATLYGGAVDGVRFALEDGQYQLVMLNNNTAQATVANVSLLPTTGNSLGAPVAQADTTVNIAAVAPSANTDTPCTLTIAQSSVELRSGPGNGYSILEYAFRGSEMPVGGSNTQSDWVLVGTDTGSGWLSSSQGTMNGDCGSLTAYDIAYQEASAPAVVYGGEEYEDDDEYEEEDDDDEEDEYEYEEEEEYEDDDDDEYEHEEDDD